MEHDDGAFDAAIIDAVKRRHLQPRTPRKPGAKKPRKTMLAMGTVRGSPAHIERLARWHYSLSLRAHGGSDDPRIARILTTIGAELETRQGPVYDQAPIRDISRAEESDHTLAQHQLAAQSLIELLTPIARGRPPGREEQDAVERGLKVFGLTPRDGWVVVVLREIERERRQMLRRKAAPKDSDDLARRRQAVFDRVRAELGDELPPHVGVALIGGILGRYGFCSKGGARATVIGRRTAIGILRSR